MPTFNIQPTNHIYLNRLTLFWYLDFLDYLLAVLILRESPKSPPGERPKGPFLLIFVWLLDGLTPIFWPYAQVYGLYPDSQLFAGQWP